MNSDVKLYDHRNAEAVARDREISTGQNQPVTVPRTTPKTPINRLLLVSGSNAVGGRACTVGQLNESTAGITDISDADHVGQARFSYHISADVVRSDAPAGVITVHPEVSVEVGIIEKRPRRVLRPLSVSSVVGPARSGSVFDGEVGISGIG
jgi:hypothetical protein